MVAVAKGRIISHGQPEVDFGKIDGVEMPAAYRRGFTMHLGNTPDGDRFIAIGESVEAAKAVGRDRPILELRIVGEGKFSSRETVSAAMEHVRRLTEDPNFSNHIIRFEPPTAPMGMPIHKGNPWNEG